MSAYISESFLTALASVATYFALPNWISHQIATSSSPNIRAARSSFWTPACTLPLGASNSFRASLSNSCASAVMVVIGVLIRDYNRPFRGVYCEDGKLGSNGAISREREKQLEEPRNADTARAKAQRVKRQFP